MAMGDKAPKSRTPRTSSTDGPTVLTLSRSAIRVAALYKFARLDDCEAVRRDLVGLCRAEGLKGTLLLAGEGINGTIAGPAEAIANVVAFIRALPGFAGL